MNKGNFLLSIAAVIVAGVSASLTYNVYRHIEPSKEDLLITENVLALSEPGDANSPVYVRLAKKYCWIPETKDVENNNGEIIGEQQVFPTTPRVFYICGNIPSTKYKSGNWTDCNKGVDDIVCSGVETTENKKPDDVVKYF